jgi:hypothetical protein
MKVLFVGEGPSDIGKQLGVHPRPAKGIVSALARRICPAIGTDSIAISWVEIPRLNRSQKGKGFEAKAAAAIALSAERFHCEGTVCVLDRDRDSQRMKALEAGRARGLGLLKKPHAVVCGLAVESVEAWVLTDPGALASILGCEEREIRAMYPHHRVEELYQQSGKKEHRPKDLLQQIVESQHREATLDFLEEVAQAVSIETLEKFCPLGFRPFAEALRAAFGTPSE